MRQVRIAVIGGTGLYQMDEKSIIDTVDIDTPFGKPSDSIKVIRYNDREVAFLPRHGTGHHFLPTEIPVKANIWALKKLGVERIIAVSAVGSLKEKIKPRDIVIPDQIIDRTRSRDNSFFGNGIVGHVSFADPVCSHLKTILHDTAMSISKKVHNNETYVCMEGPLFSTRAESNLYQSWGGGIIGMTAIPEAKLAREAEICYALMALTTDYDCWKEDEDDVTIDIVVGNLKASTKTAHAIIKKAVEKIPEERKCQCSDAAQYAIITAKHMIPASIKKKLDILYGKYWQ
ncbi:MAG: S-methyl-5'-thioadenosine phosphorylase [Spirochaetota bacterium]|nr:MAG: S-methyl-5'-thioadenosine phosphorylase [Spirochaetota bacterium]